VTQKVAEEAGGVGGLLLQRLGLLPQLAELRLGLLQGVILY
jgi:Mg2+/Co2+ transporter CorC